MEKSNMKEELEKVMFDVITQLMTGKDKSSAGAVGTAFIDWGVACDAYKNCPSREIADMVARVFGDMGYNVTLMRYGKGSIPEGTPIMYRISR